MLEKIAEMRRKYGLRQGMTRKLSLWKKRLFHPTTQRSIERQLRALGLEEGDLVLVHSAFSKIGYLKGGPETMIRAIRAVIGNEGTIFMPSFPFNDPAFRYAERGEVFDLDSTPAAVGQLQETFRRLPGTKRSLHPTHPYCAQGPKAEELVAGHHLSRNPFGPNTPLYRFVEMEGKTLLIGVGLKNCSPFRVIEDEAYPHPVFHHSSLRMKVRDADHREFEVETLVHSPTLAPIRQNEVFKEPLERRGMLARGTIGEASALLMKGTGLLPMLRELLAEGVTPYPTLSRSRPN